MEVKTSGSQKEQRILNIGNKPEKVLHYDLEYDTLNPEGTIQKFIGDIKGMLSRYEGNKARIFEIEAELNDIEHYMEIGNYKKVSEGYKLYRKLAELRRERRECKNENDLLWPVYQHFHATEVLNKLGIVQGECGKLKETIDGRVYGVKTDILNEWIEPEKKEDYIGLNLLTGETIDVTDEIPDQKEQEKKKYMLAWKRDAEVG